MNTTGCDLLRKHQGPGMMTTGRMRRQSLCHYIAPPRNVFSLISPLAVYVHSSVVAIAHCLTIGPIIVNEELTMLTVFKSRCHPIFHTGKHHHCGHRLITP